MQKSYRRRIYVLDPLAPLDPQRIGNSEILVVVLEQIFRYLGGWAGTLYTSCISQNASANRPALDSDTEMSAPDLQEMCALPCLVPEHDRKDPAEAVRELRRCRDGVDQFAMESLLSGQHRGSLAGAVAMQRGAGRAGEGAMMSVRLREMTRLRSLGL